VTALGTRYTVRLLDGQAWTAVTEGAVRIQPIHANAEAAETVHAGFSAYFDGGAVQPARPAPHAAAWVQGALYADNMRLDDFIDELGRHRPGRLACDPAFPLGDTDRILAAVERALPVQAQRYTRYWVTLRARP
jgi:transmembrane sensor